MMNLAEMLTYADIHQLGKIAQQYDCTCSTHSKHELIQSILSAMNHQDIFEQMLQSLPLEERRFLHALLFDKRKSYSLEELLAWAKKTKTSDKQELLSHAAIMLSPLREEIQTTKDKLKRNQRKNSPSKKTSSKSTKQKWTPRQTVMNFIHRGWLFGGHSHQTKYLFMVPDDIKEKITNGLTRQMLTTIRRSESPSQFQEEHDLLIRDIAVFLNYIQHHDVPLTTDGFMYKRELQKILQMLHIIEPTLERQAWRFGYGRRFKEYPNRFSLLYDYCFFQGYIVEEDERLIISEKGHGYLQSETRCTQIDLYRFWIRLYKGAIHNIQALTNWIARLTTNWTTVESLEQTLVPFIEPYYYDSPSSILRERILKMMLHLGLLRMGKHEQEGDVIQITAQGKATISDTLIDDQEHIELSVDKPIMH